MCDEPPSAANARITASSAGTSTHGRHDDDVFVGTVAPGRKYTPRSSASPIAAAITGARVRRRARSSAASVGTRIANRTSSARAFERSSLRAAAAIAERTS